MFRYVTIEREYGSGGRAIAAGLSQSCAMPCYGQEILEAAGQLLNLPAMDLVRYEESTTNSLLYSVSIIGRVQAADPDLLLRDGHLFVAEQRAIRDLAARGPSIFLGHCASEALKDADRVLNVFIKSSPEARKQRILTEYGVPAQEVMGEIKRFDRKRSGYYSINTARKWKDPQNYDVILDSSVLGIEGCIRALTALIRD